MKVCDYCKNCGGFIKWDKHVILLSTPPKYRGHCKDCGDVVTEFCHVVDEENSDERNSD